MIESIYVIPYTNSVQDLFREIWSLSFYQITVKYLTILNQFTMLCLDYLKGGN